MLLYYAKDESAGGRGEGGGSEGGGGQAATQAGQHRDRKESSSFHILGQTFHFSTAYYCCHYLQT